MQPQRLEIRAFAWIGNYILLSRWVSHLVVTKHIFVPVTKHISMAVCFSEPLSDWPSSYRVILVNMNWHWFICLFIYYYSFFSCMDNWGGGSAYKLHEKLILSSLVRWNPIPVGFLGHLPFIFVILCHFTSYSLVIPSCFWVSGFLWFFWVVLCAFIFLGLWLFLVIKDSCDLSGQYLMHYFCISFLNSFQISSMCCYWNGIHNRNPFEVHLDIISHPTKSLHKQLMVLKTLQRSSTIVNFSAFMPELCKP